MSLMVLQARCWLRLHHPKARLRLEDFLPRQLLVYLAIGAGCWLEVSAPHQLGLSTGCLNIHTTWRPPWWVIPDTQCPLCLTSEVLLPHF